MVINSGNGDGYIDLNECNMLTVALRNVCSQIAVRHNALLLNITLGITITLIESGYTDLISQRTSGSNFIPFGISADNSLYCGNPVDLSLRLNDHVSEYSVPITLPQDGGLPDRTRGMLHPGRNPGM